MSDKPIFSARQHLDAVIEATKNVFLTSTDPSHLVVAGVFEACQMRMEFLYNRADSLEADLRRAQDLERNYIQTQNANLARIAELESRVEALVAKSNE